MNLLLKAADHVGKIVRGLRVLGKTGFLRLLLHRGKLNIAKLLNAKLAGDDIHRQLFHILLILLVHAVHQADVLEKSHFVTLQFLDDFVDIDFGLVILSHNGSDVLPRFVEKTAESFSLFGIEIQPL